MIRNFFNTVLMSHDLDKLILNFIRSVFVTFFCSHSIVASSDCNCNSERNLPSLSSLSPLNAYPWRAKNLTQDQFSGALPCCSPRLSHTVVTVANQYLCSRLVS